MTDDQSQPPPWQRLPTTPASSMIWRVGPGEQILRSWGTWYKSLDQREQAEYRASHPEPQGWNGTYERVERD